jgi:hypothetical protein
VAQYRIDGQVYTADTPDQAYAMHDAANKSPGNFSGILQHFNQGLSMGGADEIQAGADALLGDTYDNSMARQKRERQAYAKEHPYIASTAVGLGAVLPVAATTILGTAAGPAGSAAGAMGSGARALSLIREALYGGGEALQGANTIRQGITQGAKSGVIPGMVAGDLSADPDSRIEGTLTGGATGAGLGGGVGGTAVMLPRAAAAGGRAVRAIDDLGMGNTPRSGRMDGGALMPQQAGAQAGPLPTITTAERKILDAMTEGGATPEQAIYRIAEARRLGVPLGLIDVGGQNVQRLARGVRTAGGEAGNTIETALDTRNRAAPERVKGYLNRALGRIPSGNAEGMLDGLLTQARQESGPYYAQMRQLPEITDENVGQMFQTPAVRDIVQNAERTRAQWARPGQPPRPPMYGENGEMLRPPTFEDVNMVKQSIEEMLSPQYQRTAGSRPADSVDISTRLPRGLATAARDDLVAAADAAPGGDVFAQARRSYAGPAQARDMYEQGLSFPEASLEDVRSSTANASPAEMKWLQRGRAEALRKGVDSMADLTSQPNVLRSFWNSPEARTKLQAAVPGQRIANMQDRLGMENQAFQTSNFVRGGSQTADKAVDAMDVAGDMAKAAGAGLKNLADKVVGEAWGAMRSAVSRETRSQIAQHLTNFGDPRQQLAFLSRLQALQAQGRLTSQAIDVAAHTAIQEQGTN